MAQENRNRVRFVFEIDNVDLTGHRRREMDWWLSGIGEEFADELGNGEILASSHWEVVEDHQEAQKNAFCGPGPTD